MVTADKDFGDLVYRRGLTTVGVLLLRAPQWPGAELAAAVVRCLARYSEELVRSFTVLSPRHIRMRKLDHSEEKDP